MKTFLITKASKIRITERVWSYKCLKFNLFSFDDIEIEYKKRRSDERKKKKRQEIKRKEKKRGEGKWRNGRVNKYIYYLCKMSS